MIKYLFIILIISSFVGCSDNRSPEAVLNKYINFRFSDPESVSKSDFVSGLTGNFKKMIDDMEDEEFRNFMSFGPYKKKKFRIIMKKCQDLSCKITYSIEYEHLNKSRPVVVSEVRKIAELNLENEDWKIADITNIKTHIDMKEEIKP